MGVNENIGREAVYTKTHIICKYIQNVILISLIKNDKTHDTDRQKRAIF